MLFSYYSNELKIRLCYLLISYLLTFLAVYIYSLDFLDLLSYSYGITKNLYYTNIFTPYTLSVKLSFYLSFFIIYPMVLIEIYYYLSPSLYKLELLNMRVNIASNILSLVLIFYLMNIGFLGLISIGETHIIKIYYKLEDFVDVYFTFFVYLTLILVTINSLIKVTVLLQNRKLYLIVNLLIISQITPPEIKFLLKTLLAEMLIIETLIYLKVVKVEYIKEKIKSKSRMG